MRFRSPNLPSVHSGSAGNADASPSQHITICGGFHRESAQEYRSKGKEKEAKEISIGGVRADARSVFYHTLAIGKDSRKLNKTRRGSRTENGEVLLCTDPTYVNLLERRALQCTIWLREL